ncbi:MAG: type II secretion system F family protein [Inhella sp.]
MTGWRYVAYGSDGRRLTGRVEAASEQEALQRLQVQQLQVVELQPEGVAASAAPGRVGDTERVLLLQEFATLLGAGVTLGEAAPSLAQAHAQGPLGQPLQRLLRAVRGGQSLAEGLQAAAIGLPRHVQSLVSAGEASGHLADALARAAEQLERERQLREQFRSALLYPAFLVVAGLAAVLFLFTTVVPRFAPLIQSGRAEVPALSRWVIETGLLLKAGWPWVLGVLALFGLAVMALLRQAGLRQQAVDALSRLPVIGPWLWAAEIGRWGLLLGTLLQQRVPLLQALQLAAEAAGLSSLRAHLQQAQVEIRRGRALSEVLSEQGWIAATRINLLRVGERSGELPRLLLELGRLHAEQARVAQQRVLQLIEPTAIVVIGLVVGVLMVAVVMAVTSVNTAAV